MGCSCSNSATEEMYSTDNHDHLTTSPATTTTIIMHQCVGTPPPTITVDTNNPPSFSPIVLHPPTHEAYVQEDYDHIEPSYASHPELFHLESSHSDTDSILKETSAELCDENNTGDDARHALGSESVTKTDSATYQYFLMKDNEVDGKSNSILNHSDRLKRNMESLSLSM
eukprot:PhF_6_TR10222/c0_g1_i3/m.15844